MALPLASLPLFFVRSLAVEVGVGDEVALPPGRSATIN